MAGYKRRPPRLDRKARFPRRPKLESSECAVAYIRVSTDEQALGPEAQKTEILTWSAENDIPIAAWHEDLGVSGRSPMDQRPALMDALESVHKNHARFLIVAARDRLSRDVSVGAMLEYEFSRSKCRILTVREDISDETPESLMMRRMLDVMAEYEVSLIRRRTKAAMAAAKANGKQVGRPGMLSSQFGREMVALVHDLSAAGFHSARICRFMNWKYGRSLYGTSWGPQLVKRCLGMDRPPEFLEFAIDKDWEP
jgi:DNA invertase Pin-like site-specific DNA recombinase